MPDDKELAPRNDGLAEAMASIPNEPLEPESERRVEDKADTPARSSDQVGGDDGPRRDEQGRFAPRGEDAPEAPQEDRDGGQVPSWRMREIREERDRIAQRAEAAERQAYEANQRYQQLMYQQQQAYQQQAYQQQRPDPINDPEGFYAYVDQLLDQRVQSVAEQNRNNWVNLTFAEQERANPELFKKAFSTLEREGAGKPAQDIRVSVNPGLALMNWYRRHTAMMQVGDDIDGYNQKYQESLLDDPEFRKKASAKWETQARENSGGRSFEGNVSNLPSVNRAPGGAGRQQLGSLGSTDREIFESLTRKR